ncbi:DEAD/DEAH box helicase family protein [Crocosphaera sp.]|uniref:DEAD/DEAH box helicase family protein n=1 Tax=Crocosphaera sp. TaxID=2729996 RepID=UPI00262C6E62|nr:DEAD/DEAH box helicase family protein [Crocosphaera sp.]MDJ0581484.1 DEAD/DEAH box helicase family protein [Crocosphaera sp.]
MKNSQNISEQQLESFRHQILDSYLSIIQDSFTNNRSQLKLINYGTGSGKTHQLFQAIFQTIQEHSDTQIIGVYVAPLREHLSVPRSIKEQYPNIPVYTINGLDMKMTDDKIKSYKKWIPSILEDDNLWTSQSEEINVEKQNLNLIKAIINRLEYFKKADFGDQKINDEQILKARRDLEMSIKKFLDFLIKTNPNEDSWSQECFELIKIFFPLYLLREKSGILMLTYDKFETKINYFQRNGEKWKKESDYLDKYAVTKTQNSRKFIFAFDEQEDGYQIILKKKIDIISPQEMAINNALSSIIREFSLLFSPQNKNNRKFLNFIGNKKGIIEQFEKYFQTNKILDPQLKEYAPIYKRLILEEGNSFDYLKEVRTINQGFEQSLKDIIEIFNYADENNPITLDFDMLSRVLAKFKTAKSLLISQQIYNKISDDLMNIFSYNNLYIYNIDCLNNLFLKKPDDGHVHIVDKKTSDNTSVAELIYTILAMRSQIEKIKKILKNVLKVDDSQSRSLSIWSEQISRGKREDEEIIKDNKPSIYINRSYVYESNKSIINIKEISRYKELIYHELREISIGSTAIFTSPEHKLNSILANSSNIIFLISATGGISGDLTTSYDFKYLEDELRGESGESAFKVMNKQEIKLCEDIRKYRQEKRDIEVNFFNQETLSFPNEQIKVVIERFKELISDKFIDSFGEDKRKFHRYKKQELERFIHFLLYLFEDDSTQETIAFTQSLRWIRQLINYCNSSNSTNFIFAESEEHPDIYYVEVKHNRYKTDIKIKLILYQASFNKNYYNKENEKTYLDELVEEENQKIFFISAYQSASKGLNPIIKTKDKQEKDFDCLVLLMDSYYTVMNSYTKKSKESDKETTLYHFALMKNLLKFGNSQEKIKDFNKYLSNPEANKFKGEQHQILLGKGILQSIGRSERRDFANQVIKIFINEETRRNLLGFYSYLEKKEPKEINKFSVNNHQVYLMVKEEEKKRKIQDYDDHVYDEIDAYDAFQDFRDEMLKEIDLFHENKNTFNIVKVWETLRDSIVFKDPEKYLEKLRKLKPVPNEFINSLFYDKENKTDFIPYLTSEESNNGTKFQMISDSINGEKPYTYQQRLYPEKFKMNALSDDEVVSFDPSTDLIYQFYNKLLPKPEIFERYIPRPYFFYDILYPSLTENFVESWIKDKIFEGKDWENIKTFFRFEQLSDFKRYNKLYEKFDLYYIKEDTLFCIDVKAWSKPSGDRLSKETLDKTKAKLKMIVENYTEFREVKGLLLNLHSAKEKNEQHSSNLSSGNLIYFDSNNCPVESNILTEFLRNQ